MEQWAERASRIADHAEEAARVVKQHERDGTPLEQKEIRNVVKAAICRAFEELAPDVEIKAP